MVLTWSHTRVGREIWCYILGLSDAFIQINQPLLLPMIDQQHIQHPRQTHGLCKTASSPFLCPHCCIRPSCWQEEPAACITSITIDLKQWDHALCRHWWQLCWQILCWCWSSQTIRRRLIADQCCRFIGPRQHWPAGFALRRVDNSLYLHSRYYIQDDKVTKKGGNITTWGFWWCSVRVLCTCQPCVRN